MTVRLSYEWGYEFTPYQGFQLRVQRDYVVAKAAFLGHRDLEVLELGPIDTPEHRFRSVTRKTVDVVLPDWARWWRFIRPSNTVTQTERWRRERSDGIQIFDLNVRIKWVPVSIRGHGELHPTGIIGCHYDVTATVRSRLPIIGPKLEEFVAGQLRHTMEGEGQFAGLWLSGQRT